jgi:hypothetical protein
MLYSTEAEVSSWPDSDKKNSLLKEIAQLRKEIVDFRKSLTEVEPEVENSVIKAAENTRKIKSGILTPEGIAALEDAITRMDFTVKDLERYVKKEIPGSGPEDDTIAASIPPPN